MLRQTREARRHAAATSTRRRARLTFADLLDLVRGDAARRGNRTAKRLGTAEQPRARPSAHLSETFGDVLAIEHQRGRWSTSTATRASQAGREAGDAQPRTEPSCGTGSSWRCVRGMLLTRMPARHHAGRRTGTTREGFVDPPEFDDAARRTAPARRLRRRSASRCALPHPVAPQRRPPAHVDDVRRWRSTSGHVVGGTLQLPGRVLKNKRPSDAAGDRSAARRARPAVAGRGSRRHATCSITSGATRSGIPASTACGTRRPLPPELGGARAA